VVRGPRENGHRPSIDALFRTAAVHLGPRVVAVVLSGSDDDGTSGAVAVRQRGGLVAVQDLDDAMYRTMPASVELRARPVASARAEELGALVADLVREAPEPEAAAPDATMEQEAAVDENLEDAVLGERNGEPSGYSCPDCNGVLFVQSEETVLRFRCRIGHAWTADGLVAQQDITVETALWSAVRTLQEKAELSERLAHRARQDGRRVSANHFQEAAQEAHHSAVVLRELLSSSALGRYPAEGAGQTSAS
jgi:two-component system chemotaxis response regulator CheB